MKIAEACVVSIHYTLTNSEGETLDSSSDGEPLSYLHGAGGLIPGLERELAGKESGDQFKATIQPEDAYGEVNPALIQEVPLDVLSGIDNLAVGIDYHHLGARRSDVRTAEIVRGRVRGR